MRRRLRKKRHVECLGFVVADVSGDPDWRERLFAAELNQEFAVGGRNSELLASHLESLVRKEGLEYVVARVSADGVDPWISSSGRVAVFAFWPREFPSARQHSGNPWPGSAEEGAVKKAVLCRFPQGLGSTRVS